MPKNSKKKCTVLSRSSVSATSDSSIGVPIAFQPAVRFARHFESSKQAEVVAGFSKTSTKKDQRRAPDLNGGILCFELTGRKSTHQKIRFSRWGRPRL